jgi:hypothetical protein
MRAVEFIVERKKRKRKPRWAAYGPGPYGGYGYYAGYSGDSGGGEGGGGESIENEDAMMGKIEDGGKIVRILKKQHTVPFSDEKNWLLIDTDPAKGNKGLGLKWVPASTRFTWVRPYKETVEKDVSEGLEQITEYRDRLLQYVKSLLPTWPEYVLKDWLVPNKGDFSNLPTDAIKNGIMEKVQGAGLTPSSKWQLVPNMKFTMDMFDPKTKQLLIGRAGGSSDLGMGIPKDKERHATQAALAQQQGGVRKEPVLLIKTANGYELLEGWHRTIQHFVKYPDGYTGPAYVAVAQDVSENFADGRNPQDKGDSKRHGINTKASVSSLRKTAKQGGRKGQLAHWLANMKAGRAKKNK